jgi:predicted nucleic acid-binding protein
MGLSSLINSSVSVVADTSAVINLNASGFGPAILRALPNPFVITDVVLDELREDTRSGRNDAELVALLIKDHLITIASIDALKGDDFERLVSGGAATTLDDGEAATIAYASENGMVAIVDERKANQICQTRYADMLVGSTMDLFAHPNVESALGKQVLADAVHSALVGARMRVLPKYLEWTVELVGADRAQLCESLPKHIRRHGNAVKS